MGDGNPRSSNWNEAVDAPGPPADFPRATASKPSVLLIDPDRLFTGATVSGLESRGYSVRLLDSPGQTQINSLSNNFSVVVMELSSEGMPRFDLLQLIRKRFLTARVVIVSAYGSLRVAVAALRKGADDYLVKPVTVTELLRAIKEEDEEASSLCLGDFPSLAKVEWEYIARVLQSVEWNISAAARVLGIGRSTLQRKLRKYPPHR